MRTFVTFRDIELEVYYDYQPGEEAILNDSDGSGYPGYPESYDIRTIKVGKNDITSLFDEKMIEELIEEIRK